MTAPRGASEPASRAPRHGARLGPAGVALAMILLLAGCASSAAGEPSGASGGAAGATSAAAPRPAPAGCTSSKVSANVASIEVLAAAFESAGIPNAQRWAEEVDEYRPYPDDPTWAKLDKELGKYNIDPAVYAAIVSCLSN